MVTRTKDQNTLSLGDWNVICDVCGFKFKSCDLKKRWDGLYVCKEDWEPRHPSDFYKGPKEDISVPWSRPEQTDNETVGGNTAVDGSTFPPAINPTANAEGVKPDSDDDGYVEGDFLEDGEAQADEPVRS